MSAIRDTTLLRQQVIDFQMEEIGLLQAGRLTEWLGLLEPEIRYWMPIQYIADDRKDGESGPNDLAYYDDTYETLELRVKRALSRWAWTELPFSRVRYFLQPLTIKPNDGGTIAVLSNMLVYQTRLDREENWFVGQREDVIRIGQDGAFKVLSRKITVDRTVLPSKNLTVFF